MRLNGNNVVNTVLGDAISQWSQLVQQKSSALNMHYQDGEAPSLSHHDGHKWQLSAIKQNIIILKKGNTQKKNMTHLNTHSKQVEFLKFALEKGKISHSEVVHMEP